MSAVQFSDILMVLKNTRLKSCERIYTIDFSLFLNINSLFIYLFKSSKTHTSVAPLLLEKGAEVKMKLQDLKLLILIKYIKKFICIKTRRKISYTKAQLCHLNDHFSEFLIFYKILANSFKKPCI